MPTVSGHTNAIRAGKAIGTNVYDLTGNKIGDVKDIVLEKTANNILFAVIGFGGVLGIGEKYHPVPWSELDYDPQLRRVRRLVHDGAVEERSGRLARSLDEGRRHSRSAIAHSRTTARSLTGIDRAARPPRGGRAPAGAARACFTRLVPLGAS